MRTEGYRREPLSSQNTVIDYLFGHL